MLMLEGKQDLTSLGDFTLDAFDGVSSRGYVTRVRLSPPGLYWGQKCGLVLVSRDGFLVAVGPNSQVDEDFGGCWHAGRRSWYQGTAG